jgi:hypothetical protein
MKKNYYINFLNLLKAIDTSPVDAQLDSTAKLILEEIAIGVSNDKLLTVSDVMNLKQLGSPATLHRKLDLLLNVKLVEATFKGTNRRTKYIDLTASGKAYFDRLSSAIQSVQPGGQ